MDLDLNNYKVTDNRQNLGKILRLADLGYKPIFNQRLLLSMIKEVIIYTIRNIDVESLMSN